MNRDDRMIYENVTPIRRDTPAPILPYQGSVPVIRKRTTDQQIRNMLEELDDLHATDRWIKVHLTITRVVVLGLIWHVAGWWPMPWVIGQAVEHLVVAMVVSVTLMLIVVGGLALVTSAARQGLNKGG